MPFGTEPFKPLAEVGAALRIAQRGDHPRRLMKHDVAERRANNELAVDLDFIFAGVRLGPELGRNRAVDSDSALLDPPLGLTPRREAGAGDNFLQALHRITAV